MNAEELSEGSVEHDQNERKYLTKWVINSSCITLLSLHFTTLFIDLLIHLLIVEARRGAGVQSVTVKPTSCGFDPHSRR